MGESCSKVSGREVAEGPLAGQGLRTFFPAPQKQPAAEGSAWGAAVKLPAAAEGCAGEGVLGPSFASTNPGTGTLSYASSQDASFGDRQLPAPAVAAAVAAAAAAGPAPTVTPLSALPASPAAIETISSPLNSGETISSPSLSTNPSLDGAGRTPTSVADTPASTSSADRSIEIPAEEAAPAAADGPCSSEETVSSPDMDSSSTSSRERLAGQLARIYDQLCGDCGKLAYVTGADLPLLRSRAAANADAFAVQFLEGIANGETAAVTSADLDSRLVDVLEVVQESPASPTALGNASPWTIVERHSRYKELKEIYAERSAGDGAAVRLAAAIPGSSAILIRKNPPEDADDFALKVLRGHYSGS